MAELDIRKQQSEVTSIRVADNLSPDEFNIASVVSGWVVRNNYIKIEDSAGEYVVVHGVDHAKDLIKGIEKAISLGWIK